MNSKAEKKENDNTFLTGYTIYIVGPHLFCCELLSRTIESQTGAQCLCLKSFEEISENSGSSSQSNLILWDCLGKNLNDFMNDFVSFIDKIVDSRYLALLNVTPGLGIEDNCVNQGVRGIFYEDDSLKLFLKGVHAIYKGELWFSREVMSKFILEDKNEEIISLKVRRILTHREIEIISLLAVGHKNEQIADKLCVSPHTIKTHLYNIYKKINVTNRLQATLWAAKNL
jgi:DNA-binding CsgD family transcriptional regulator